MATTCPALRFVERDPHGLAGDSSFWELYGASFERTLREPSGALIEGVRSGKVLAFAAEDDGRTLGLAAVHLLEAPATSLLLYLAVVPELRGQRIGSTLLTHALAVARERQELLDREPRGWAVQVDVPELAPTLGERERRRRILLFFRSQGAKPLPCAYVRPPVRGGTPAAARLLHAPDGSLPLRREEVQALLQSIYFEKFAGMNGVDRRLLLSLLGPAPAGAPGVVLPGASARVPPWPSQRD
ncbi:GNAT family N-acetyltransferase [Vulgatibacter sp.]|uniref:GNAT family N-acetyltransferase n=1 Tax=Vulgatibacter sp. TaxID=1971226 RepID=UPI00356273A7